MDQQKQMAEMSWSRFGAIHAFASSRTGSLKLRSAK